MSKEPNPSYPNPTIQEAICALRFDSPQGAEGSGKLFGNFVRLVATEFPYIEPVAQVNFQLQIGLAVPGQSFAPPQTMQFRHKSRNLIMQLTDGLISIHVLPKYDTWENMKLDILSAWGNLEEAISVTAVTQVSIRYINLIPRESAGEVVGKWLNQNNFIPQGLLGSKPPFFSRVDALVDDTSRCVVNLAYQPPGQLQDVRNAGHGAIVLDIERSKFNNSQEGLPVGDTVEHLHDGVYDVFRSAKTAALEELLWRE